VKELFEKLVLHALQEGAFDFHVKAGRPPFVRLAGSVRPTNYPVFTVKQLDALIAELLHRRDLEKLQQTGHVDTLYNIPDKCRLRINVFFQRGSLSLSVRMIPPKVPRFGSLGFPVEIQNMATSLKSGLILITGATNSGKSSTLNSLVQEICLNDSVHVVTIEDPVEFKFPKFPSSIVNQRQVGTDANSFLDGLRSALRQDPDIIVIGELRTVESIATSLQAAETGHLVISTLHTRSAAQTILRLINVFPPHQADGVRFTLANTLKMVISQTLLPSADGKGRVLAYEVMPMFAAVCNLVRVNRVFEIPNIMTTGQKFGCVTLPQTIDKLVKQGKVLEKDVPLEYRIAKVKGG
jgi:twitching motility protein PilT